MSWAVERNRGAYVALGAVGVFFFPIYCVALCFGAPHIHRSNSVFRAVAETCTAVTLLLHLIFYICFYITMTSRWFDLGAFITTNVAGPLAIVSGAMSVAFGDLAIVDALPAENHAKRAVRKLRTAALGLMMFATFIVPFFFPIFCCIVLPMMQSAITKRAGPSPRNSTATYVLGIISALLMWPFFGGEVAMTIVMSFSYDYTILIILFFVLLIHVALGLAFIGTYDTVMIELLNDATYGNNTGVVGGGGGGARIITPGNVPGGARQAACPSCQVVLEYTAAANGAATQVECYNCKAIVEFD